MIQVIDRVIDILEFLAVKEDQPVPLADIAAQCKLRKTTCANILRSLRERNYVENAGRLRGYVLGYRAYLLVGSPEYFNRLGRLAADALQKVFDVTGETVVLATEHRDRREIISTLESQYVITAHITHSTDLYRSSIGRIMLAFSPREKSDAIIGRIGLPDVAAWSGIRSLAVLESRLAEIRRAGICVTHGFGEVVGVAVPVFKNGEIIAGVGICLPEYRFTEEKFAIIRKALNDCARAIRAKC